MEFILYIWYRFYLLLNTWVQKTRITGKKVRFYPTGQVINLAKKKSKIIIGDNTHIKGELLVYAHGGSIKIGEDCFVGNNSKIWAAKSIEIGNRVLISHDINIHDNNSHPLDSVQRHEAFVSMISNGHSKNELDLNEKPIFIGDDVWIGFNSTITKGVSIGNGAIIASNSNVLNDVEPFTVVGGNPAKMIRKLNEK